MGWTVYGDRWESGELSNTNKFIRIKPNDNIILKAVRTWIIINNNPTFTNLTMKIYSDNDNSPLKLLHSSLTTLSKSSIITQNNGVKEVYFLFNEVPLQENTYYDFVMQGSGYSYTYNSHLAWKKAWPDPVLSGYTPSLENLGTSPYELYLIGAEL